jgi:hypothetical protein
MQQLYRIFMRWFCSSLMLPSVRVFLCMTQSFNICWYGTAKTDFIFYDTFRRGLLSDIYQFSTQLSLCKNIDVFMNKHLSTEMHKDMELKLHMFSSRDQTEKGHEVYVASVSSAKSALVYNFLVWTKLNSMCTSCWNNLSMWDFRLSRPRILRW